MQDEKKSGQHAGKSEGPHSETSPKILVRQTGDSTRNDEPAEDVQKKSHARQKPRLPLRLWRILRRKRLDVPRANWAEKSTVFITIVIAFIGGVQAYIYSQQKQIMQSSGGQTDQLICAANIQAQATQTISGYTGAQVKIMGQQNVLQKQIANGILGAPLVNLRPDWLGLYNMQQGQRLTVEVQLENDGKTNGYLGRVAFDVKFLAKPPKPQFTDSDFRETNQPTLFPPPYHAIARKEIADPISSQQYSTFKLGQAKLYIWGQIRYYNPITGEQPTVDFCRYVTATPEVLKAGKIAGYAGPYGICDETTQ